MTKVVFLDEDDRKLILETRQKLDEIKAHGRASGNS